MSKTPPKVFISYSHDSPEHRKWVAKFSVKLRENGVDAILDQWDLYPGEDVPSFMEKNLSDCDFAILICTKRYVEKANSGKGGVGYEKMIVSAEMIKDIEIGKFIPVIRQSGTQNVPTFIQTKMYLDFSEDEYFEAIFDELLRTLFKTVVSKKPPLGSAPAFDSGKVQSTKQHNLTNDTLDIFTEIVRSYDSGAKTYWNPNIMTKISALGKIASETALITLEARGLLQRDKDGDYVLSTEGKIFAQENGIV